MHLNPVAASVHFGKAAYGTATVSIMGAVPASLSGVTAGALFGPSWLAANGSTIAYQNGGTGSGPWKLQSYNVTAPALVDLEASPTGQNFMAAGGGVWAAYLAGSGVRSNVTIASPTLPLSGAYVLDVSPDGQIVLCDSQSTGIGISVYNNVGTKIYDEPTAALASPIVRLIDDLLSWQDQTGWHIRDITTGEPPLWYPRLDAVNWLVPVLLADGTLCVLERTEELSIRRADKSVGFIVQALPIAFNPDAIEFSAGVVRLGYCTALGEATSTLELFDVTMATGANTKGVVSGGTVVFTPQAVIAPTQFVVGAAEGGGDGLKQPPVQEPITDPQSPNVPYRVTDRWRNYFQQENQKLTSLQTQINKIPPPSVDPSFGTVTVDTAGQPAIVASVPSDIANFRSADKSIQFFTDPITKTIDFRVRQGGSTGGGMPGWDGEDGWIGPPGQSVASTAASVCYVPVSTGAEPLEIMSDGAGSVLLVAFTP